MHCIEAELVDVELLSSPEPVDCDEPVRVQVGVGIELVEGSSPVPVVSHT